MANLTFEQALKRFEEIVEALETEDLDLEKSLQFYVPVDNFLSPVVKSRTFDRTPPSMVHTKVYSHFQDANALLLPDSVLPHNGIPPRTRS